VADELEEKVGEFVDYVDSDSRIESKRAKIVFKLDRIVLDEMIADPALSNYSCLVLDEAHERTINIDVIIGILHNLFKKARKSFKAIITSASMDIKLF
jgi:HrpA-like RNA helicase